MEDLKRLNDRIYFRCPVCHQDLTRVEATANKWLHRLVGATRMSAWVCVEHSYIRIEADDASGSSTTEFFHGEEPKRAVASRGYR